MKRRQQQRLIAASTFLLLFCGGLFVRPTHSRRAEEYKFGDKSDEKWGGSTDGHGQSVSAEEEAVEKALRAAHNTMPRKHSDNTFFKRFVQLDNGSDESWPERFYDRTVNICLDQPGTSGMRISESERGCPGGKATTVAMGRYRAAINETGWGILEVETFGSHPPEWQAFAAGLAEGSLTKQQIATHYRNTVKGLCHNNKAYCKRLFRYLNANLAWISEQIGANGDDLYWRHVNLTLNQLTGISDGYSMDIGKSFTPNANFSTTPVFMLQLSGEFYDLDILFKKLDENNKPVSPGMHCSALVKVADGNKDLLVSHVTMGSYNSLNRIIKLYKFAYDPKEVPGFTVTFSGYPATLASSDDFTLTSAGLVGYKLTYLALETTITVYNTSLYDNFVHARGQLLCWLRSYIANQLASTAHDWVKVFARFNSGTYNNQWTVIDYKLFKPGQPLPNSDLAWIIEQIPGTTDARDITWFLRRYNYWPSYNIPFLRRISELSGFERKGAENDWWKWGFCPRARIFRRDQHKVQDIDTLRALMRYNNYKHDEFSRCVCSPPYTAEAGISARDDLNPANGTYQLPEMGHRNYGSLDYKGTNSALFKQLRFEVVGGPTYGGPGNLPAFNWETTDLRVPHEGQPTVWQFEPFVTQWVTPVHAAQGTRKREGDE